ncbi:MAG: sugar phosphate isomerase/epimerase family protein [Thermoguttaceae bacterium]
MIVAASTSCISCSSLTDVLDRLADLEYTHTEFVIGKEGTIRISELSEQFDQIVHICRVSRRITPASIFFDMPPDHPGFLESFKIACKLAKTAKIIVITIHASELGTPFNEEVERLRELSNLGVSHGVVVGLQTEQGHITESPDTIGSLCKSVKGLGITLDPSAFVYNCEKPKDYDSILEHVCHVRLRDTSQSQFQTRVGQGIIEFGRLVIQLTKIGYRRSLCVDLAQLPDLDPLSELRKMRLLLESLL